MKSIRPDLTPWCSALCLCLVAFVFLSCSGCGGKNDETANHIFTGDTPIAGTVQVATNEPIAVISLGQNVKEKANWELRDCGQFVLVPPHIYRAVRADLELLEKYRLKFGEMPEGEAHAKPSLEHFLLYRVPDDGARSEIVEL